MATKTEQKFVIKKVKQGNREGQRFFNEVGRMTLRETEKGVTASIYLHHLDGDFVAFPVDPKPEGEAPQA
jgi:hypothetical protein